MKAFNSQLQKVNTLLDNAKKQSILTTNSIALISSNISRSKAFSKHHPSYKPKQQIKLSKQGIPKRFQKILQSLFRTKCQTLQIQFNDKNWQTFIKAFFLKNKIVKNHFEQQVINLNDFNFQEGCVPFINLMLQQNKQLVCIRLNKNYINPNNLVRIQTFKELCLCNCKLGNDILQQLFAKLTQSVIERISLSSPEIKNRNQLTKYDKLIKLIQTSSTLRTLELSNIEIHPQSMILESSRNTCLKHIDLSDNSLVRGICPSVLSLNLSRNGITHPFIFPIVSNQIQYLNLSYNKIPYYHFKDFLKLAYFPSLKQLVLDHIMLDGDISAIQFYLQQSLSLLRLSMVDCDLAQVSYMNISLGIKHSRSLQTVDLTRNRVMSAKVAQHLSQMLQSCSLKSIKMRHCDIKDKLGSIIFAGLHKNKYIEKVDMMNNLLGDQTAKTICQELKNTKTITCLLLDENIIKYKDMHQIKSYLSGNKYFSIYQLDKDYHKLQQVNQQIQQANLIMNSQGEKIDRLQKDTQALHRQYLTKYKQLNQPKKIRIKAQIKALRTQQNEIIGDMNLRQSLASMTDLDESIKESYYDNT